MGGTANQVMDQGVYVWSASTDGVPNQLVSVTTGTGGLASTASYNYAFDRQLATTTASDGGQTSDTINTAHDLTSSTTTTGSLDADNQTTASVYDALHRVTSETSYQSPSLYSATTNTYTGADLTAVQTVDQNSNLLAASASTYDAQGRTTQEKQLVTGTVQSGVWTQTDYSDFAACGEPQTTVAQDIRLSSAGSPQDLTKTASYDAFGNMLSESDWGARTTATNTFDIAGRQLTSTDPAGVVTHTAYDCLGNATESWRTVSGTQMKADWSATSYDAMGGALTVTTKLSDASGNPTTQSIVTSTYDGAGNELTSDDTTQGGQAAKTTYDASGNATQDFGEGALNYTDAARSTRSVYDAAGNVTYESGLGNPSAPGSGATCTATTYDDAGNVTSESQPDGTETLHAYDGQSNERLSEGDETTSAEFAPWEEESSYDAAGQQVSQTDPQQSHTGLETTTTLDLLGRTTATTAQRDGVTEQSTTTTYNDLGWVLESVDANGVTTQTTYDTHGAVSSQTIGGETTTNVYDATTGRLLSTTDDNGTVLTCTYDAFGRVVRELHQSNTAVTLKDVGGPNGRSLDSLGRTLSETEAVSGVTHAFSYPENAATGVQETVTYAGSATSLAITRNGRGMETARTATVATGTTLTRSVADPSGRDSADRWTAATLQLSGGSQLSLGRTFDAAGRMSAQSGLGLTAAASYGYDPNSGRETSRSLPLALGGAISDSFTYYPGGRLATATTNGFVSSYTFDEAGNLTGDAVTDVGTTAFAYDAANRLTQSSYLPALEGASEETTYYGWDATHAWRTSQGSNSNPTQANEPIDLSYNAQGRMASYANSDTSTAASYTYDAAGQRTKSEVTISGVTTTTTYTYEGLTLLSLSATQGVGSWRIDYLYTEEGVPYAGVYRSPADDTPVCFTIVTNDHGDVLEFTDTAGAAFCAYRYDAWGLPQGAGSLSTGVWTQATGLVSGTLASEIATRQILRYAAYAWDAENGFYYCSARYYDPATRQWTTGDPAKADGEQSAYQYCGGEPVGGVDASGRYAANIHFPPYRTGADNSGAVDQTNYFRNVCRLDAGVAWIHGIGSTVRSALSGPAVGETLRNLWFGDMVWEHHKWDFKWASSPVAREKYYIPFKGKRISPNDFGNLHFGYTGRACGFPEWWLVRAADLVNSLVGGKSAEDQARADRMTRWGYDLYQAWGHHWVAPWQRQSQVHMYVASGGRN